MSTSVFQKASKSLAKAKIAINGPAGAGKTLGALLLAKGLGSKVAVIDTENNSASLYEDRFDGWEYFTLPINPPYAPSKVVRAIDIAIAEGFDTVIIDSLSHFWAGEGGLLGQKDALDAKGGNGYTNWNKTTKIFEELKSKILHSPIHVICTMRSKQAYVLETTDKGKQVPKKVGLAPVMRDGMEYEFTVVFDVGMDHQFMVSKDRTDLFKGIVGTINEETGREIKDWLYKTPPPPPEPPKNDPPPTPVEPKRADPGDWAVHYGPYQGELIKSLPENALKEMYLWTEKDLAEIPPGSKDSVKVFTLQTKIREFLISVDCWPKSDIKAPEAQP